MTSRRGITLLELLTAVFIVGLLATSLAASFSAAVRYQTQTRAPRQELLQQIAFEDKLKNLISRAYVDEDLANDHTYFIGQLDPAGDTVGDAGTGATELIFTTTGGPMSGRAIADIDTDFEARNERLGPVGGVTENRLALTPIGDAGDRLGIFHREQTPADMDPDQGGYETVIDDRVVAMSFEFYDGTDWLPEWDTRIADRRVPAAVRVTYMFDGDETPRELIVKMRNSDVTPNNPANATAVAGGRR